MEWNDRFMQLFTESVYRYHEPMRPSVERFFLPEETELLASIGYTPEEMYDYVRDFAVQGEPSPSTVLLIAAARRAFFTVVQRGIMSNTTLRECDLPRESEGFQDIAYLPRIISKAEAKLDGTLPKTVMYYCEKDRAFLRSHGDIHPADFLYVVWWSHRDKQKVVSYVLRAMKEKGESQPPQQQNM